MSPATGPDALTPPSSGKVASARLILIILQNNSLL